MGQRYHFKEALCGVKKIKQDIIAKLQVEPNRYETMAE